MALRSSESSFRTSLMKPASAIAFHSGSPSRCCGRVVKVFFTGTSVCVCHVVTFVSFPFLFRMVVFFTVRSFLRRKRWTQCVGQLSVDIVVLVELHSVDTLAPLCAVDHTTAMAHSDSRHA